MSEHCLFSGSVAMVAYGISSSAISPRNSINEDTEKYICNRDGQTGLSGIDIAPTHGGLSIVKELRVYTANNCAGCDVTAYILQGRVNPTSSWITIGEGGLDAMPGVNPRGLDIVSTFESGDNNYEYVSVTFRDNTEAFLEYRLSVSLCPILQKVAN